jgi:8-amino-7-oxononanoate synthase
MNYYEKELQALQKANRFRSRKIYSNDIYDFASNDYLGLGSNLTQLNKAFNKLKKYQTYTPKASMLVNGYTTIHKKFEDKLAKINQFESAIVVGSGFLANISLIESLCRIRDLLFVDEKYHASGILATKLTNAQVVTFRHNNTDDLEQKIRYHKQKKSNINRIIIAIEGVYSMEATIASKKFDTIAYNNDAILIVDEAHSSGTIGKNLLGWFDYHNIKPQPYHIKMGTLGKAYGSYGAYILATKHIISYLENRAKPIIYSTALSLFDVSLASVNLKYIQKNKKQLKKQINTNQQIVKQYLQLEKKPKTLIIPILTNTNQKALLMQQKLLQKNFLVGAIRQPTVQKPILRVIIRLGNDPKKLKQLLQIVTFC